MTRCSTEIEAKGDEISTSAASAASENATRLNRSTTTKIIKQREIDDDSKALIQFIQELYDSGAKLWTKEMFCNIEAELAKEPLPDYIINRSSKYVLVYPCHHFHLFPVQ